MTGKRVQEVCVRKCKRALRLRGRHGPHQTVVIALGQKRHRTLGSEPFEGYAAMRVIEGHLGDQRDLAIVALFPRDAGDRCSGSVGDDTEAGMQRFAASFELYGRLSWRSRHRGGGGAEADCDAGMRERGIDGRLQRTIGHNIAERGHPQFVGQESGDAKSTCLRNVDFDDRRHCTAQWRSGAPIRRAVRRSAARHGTAPACGRRAAWRRLRVRRAQRCRDRHPPAPAPAHRRPDPRRR